MRRGMEKEKKGLFGRLLDFWKEKISLGETEGIGFWNDTENAENHFAEMGAVASLTQEETKKAFWKETAGMTQDETEERIFFVEEAEKEKPIEEEKEAANKKRNRAKLFAEEVFRNGGWETEATEESRLGEVFLWEMPEEEKTARNIIPVAEEAEQEEEATETEAGQEIPMEEIPKREEKQRETQIDIEKLMRQMTKKLWEERESCGRRLR